MHIRPTAGAMQAMLGWMAAEGGHWNNSAKYNPLNTTRIIHKGERSMNGAGVKVYGSWEDGLRATIETLKLPAYRSIVANLKSGNAMGVANAIESSPWGTGGLAKQTIPRAPRHAGSDDGFTTTRQRAISGTAQPQASTTKQQFDSAAYEDARKKAILAQYIGQHQPDSPLVKLGVLDSTPPDPANYVKEIAQQKAATRTAREPSGSRSAPAGHSSGLPGDIGRVGHWLERSLGLPVTARQEPGHAVGGDHDPAVRGATARDFGGDETARKAAFLKLARALGVRNPVYKGADINIIKNGLRYQVISRDHGTGPHLHVGVRKA